MTGYRESFQACRSINQRFTILLPFSRLKLVKTFQPKCLDNNNRNNRLNIKTRRWNLAKQILNWCVKSESIMFWNAEKFFVRSQNKWTLMLGFVSNYVNIEWNDDQNRKQLQSGLLLRSMTGVVADRYPPRSHVFVLLYKCLTKVS